MAVEERLVDRHIFQRFDPFSGLNIQHPVNQQKRVTMGQVFPDLLDIHHHVFHTGKYRKSRKLVA
jgi:hypothetical protein